MKLKLVHALAKSFVTVVSDSFGTSSRPQLHLLIQQMTPNMLQVQPRRIQVYIRQLIM